MSGFAKLDKYKVVEKKNGAVYKTKKVGFAWFPINSQPANYIEDETGHIWVSTTDYHFGPICPAATPPDLIEKK